MLHDQYRGAALCAGDEGAASFQRQAFDYARHSVTTLLAALEVATGQVTDAYYPRHRHQEFLRFLKRSPPPSLVPNRTSSATTTRQDPPRED